MSAGFLSKILGGELRLKLLKFFIFNKEKVFSYSFIEKKFGGNRSAFEKEIKFLESLKFLKQKIGKEDNKKVKLFFLNPNFQFTEAMRDFFLKVSTLTFEELIKRFQKVCRLKLLAVSGVFINDTDSRVDLLIVGDKFKKNNLSRIISSIELDLGREIRYSVLESNDFEYRFGVGDKLVRDVFEFPHKLVLNRISSLGLQSV